MIFLFFMFWITSAFGVRYLSFACLKETHPHPVTVAFARVHDGHCAAGWIEGKNICVSSPVACAESCIGIKECGYFAYTKDCGEDSKTNCALYTITGACADDDNFLEYDAYRLSRNQSECMSLLLCMYGMGSMHFFQPI